MATQGGPQLDGNNYIITEPPTDINYQPTCNIRRTTDSNNYISDPTCNIRRTTTDTSNNYIITDSTTATHTNNNYITAETSKDITSINNTHTSNYYSVAYHKREGGGGGVAVTKATNGIKDWNAGMTCSTCIILHDNNTTIIAITLSYLIILHDYHYIE